MFYIIWSESCTVMSCFVSSCRHATVDALLECTSRRIYSEELVVYFEQFFSEKKDAVKGCESVKEVLDNQFMKCGSPKMSFEMRVDTVQRRLLACTLNLQVRP